MTGAVLIFGSILFLVAAFSPISRIFAEPDAHKKLEIILNEKSAWTFSQVFFALGALITAAGLGLTVYQLRATPDSAWAYSALAALVIGAVLWSWDVYLRAADPPAFVAGTLPAWPFITYTLLTQAGLAVVGIVLLRSALPVWVAWLLIGGSLLFFVLYLVLKDMPPFVYYILTLVAGIVLVWP
jgi:hypothetical protein